MKTSVVVLTPATKNKAGECVELEYESGPVQFLAPVSYAANDDLGKLRHDEHVAAAALRHGKARGAKAAEIAKLQSAFEAAKSAVDKIHLQMQKQRQAEKTGESPFARQSEDHRVFAEVVDYSRNVDEGELRRPVRRLAGSADPSGCDCTRSGPSEWRITSQDEKVSGRTQGVTRSVAESFRPTCCYYGASTETVLRTGRPSRRGNWGNRGTVPRREETPRFRPRLEGESLSRCASSEEDGLGSVFVGPRRPTCSARSCRIPSRWGLRPSSTRQERLLRRRLQMREVPSQSCSNVIGVRCEAWCFGRRVMASSSPEPRDAARCEEDPEPLARPPFQPTQ
jgi:hypothetical protein